MHTIGPLRRQRPCFSLFQAITVGILQAVVTTALADVALVALHLIRPDIISMASAITLGSIAAATAPAATLMVVKQYKADGPLTHLLLMVVAIDDAVGLVLFSASFGITLLPQAGVALGMAAEAAVLSDGYMVRNVVLFSVLVYELVGPTLTKLALTAAGEIIPEGRTSARTANKPEVPVSLD